MKSVLTSLVKTDLLPLELTTAATQRESLRWGKTLIISDGQFYENKSLKSVEELDLLIKGITETTKNKTKKRNGRFPGMPLGASAARTLGNMLPGKGVIRACEEVTRARWYY